MPVKSPKERVYYYECSYGKFRLTYFIPFGELEKLSEEGKIEKQVLDDFPDGIDLRVGETDYVDFKNSYGYRPEVDPEVAKSVFYSIFSTTKDWKKFRGSDIIPAKDLEGRISDIDRKMMAEKNKSLSDSVKPPREKIRLRAGPEGMYRIEKADLKRYRVSRKRRAAEQRDVDKFLRKVRPKGIDPKKTLRRQGFSKMQWTEGDNIGDVFARIQQKKLRRSGEKP